MPWGLCVGGDGELLVADSEQHVVWRLELGLHYHRRRCAAWCRLAFAKSLLRRGQGSVGRWRLPASGDLHAEIGRALPAVRLWPAGAAPPQRTVFQQDGANRLGLW